MSQRWLSGAGALICSASVALGAYASHLASAHDQHRLVLAAAFGFAHALSLLVLAPRQRRLAQVAKLAMFAGIVLFCGSLAAAALAGWSTRLVPFGGSLLIISWLLVAADYLRGE